MAPKSNLRSLTAFVACMLLTGFCGLAFMDAQLPRAFVEPEASQVHAAGYGRPSPSLEQGDGGCSTFCGRVAFVACIGCALLVGRGYATHCRWQRSRVGNAALSICMSPRRRSAPAIPSISSVFTNVLDDDDWMKELQSFGKAKSNPLPVSKCQASHAYSATRSRLVRGPSLLESRSPTFQPAADSDDEGLDFGKAKSMPMPQCPGRSSVAPVLHCEDSGPETFGPFSSSSSRLSSRTLRRSSESAEPLPTLLNLSRLFMVSSVKTRTDREAMAEAVRELNARYHVGFQESDAVRIYNMISKNGKEELNGQAFAAVVRELLSALSSRELTLSQLRVVFATAFDQFDMNEDGIISVDEFTAALRSYNITVHAAEAATLLRFLNAKCEEEASDELETDLSEQEVHLEREALAESASVEEQFQAALASAQEKLAETSGWNSAMKMLGRSAGKSGSESLAEVAELAVTAAGVGLVLMNHGQLIETHLTSQFWSAWDALGDFADTAQDLSQSVPMLPVLFSGLVGVAKAQKEPVALDENEALLYARSFHPKGCSLNLFHKLIAQAECHWGSVPANGALECDREIRILVRGKGQRSTGSGPVEVLPGSVLQSEGSQALATETAMYIAWDKVKLQEYIAHVKDQKVIALVQELFKESNCGSPPSKAQQDSDEPGWLSPVRSALMLQAKRKGLACSSLCPESLHRIWTKPKTSLREKLDQCRALMLNSADEILDSLEALSDLSSACSLMVALGNKTATLSPHNALQLAPILILVSLVGAHAANEEGKGKGPGSELS